MRAMILAAGRGIRMGHLTDQLPKPLLTVGVHRLITYAIFALKRAGVTDIVINVSYQGKRIKEALGSGKDYGVTLTYTEEPERLETGGGIFNALPLLGREPFLVMSSDIITDVSLSAFVKQATGLAHLLLVNNPPYHPKGDFGLHAGCVNETTQPFLTFANVSYLHPDLFADCRPGRFPLVQILKPAVLAGHVTGELHRGLWYNIGTAADLAWLNERAREDSNLRPLVSETNTLSN